MERITQGLTIDELTLEGRIAHFADSYDALVTRQDWSSSQVCDAFCEKYQEIGRSDDAILEAFVRVVERHHADRINPPLEQSGGGFRCGA